MTSQRNEDPRSHIYEERRPWGGFRRYTHNQLSTVKIITVKPGEILSLQYHHHRDELWVALDEGLRVTLGDRRIVRTGSRPTPSMRSTTDSTWSGSSMKLPNI